MEYGVEGDTSEVPCIPIEIELEFEMRNVGGSALVEIPVLSQFSNELEGGGLAACAGDFRWVEEVGTRVQKDVIEKEKDLARTFSLRRGLGRGPQCQ